MSFVAAKKELDFTAEEKSKYKENHSTCPGFTPGGLKINVFLCVKSLLTPDVKSGKVLRFLSFATATNDVEIKK